MGVPSGSGAAGHAAQSRAGTVAEPAGMVVAAVGGLAVDVPSGNGAVLYGAQGRAGTIADAVGMVVTAEGHTAVSMPSAGMTGLHGTDAAVGHRSLGGSLMVASAVGRRREHEHQGCQDCHCSCGQPSCMLH